MRFLADENFNNIIVRTLLRGFSDFNMITVQQAGMEGALDSDVLNWAADNDRILLTHDWRTIPDHAWERIAANLRMPGVLVVPSTLSVKLAIEEISIIAGCTAQAEWRDRIVRLRI